MLFMLLISSLLALPTVAAAPDIEWNRTYEGNGYSIIAIDDGFVITGSGSGGNSGSDVWLAKTDLDGNLVWSKHYGGASTEIGWSVAACGDGYVVVGYTTSFGEHGDIYLVRTDLNGNMLWNKTYGESKLDCGYDVAVVSDGYILTGYVNWDDTHGDIFLLKTDLDGNVVWNKHYDRPGGEGKSIVVTSDGYVVGGSRDLNAQKSREFYLLKTDFSGNIIWENTYGDVREDTCYGMAATNDGYLMTGRTRLIGYGDPDPNIYDILLVKTDLNGNQLWTKALGTSDIDQGESVVVASDGYIIAGETLPRSNMNDIHLYLVKTDFDGNVMWEKTTAGNNYRYGYSEAYRNGACYITGTYGGSDQTYLVKISSDAPAQTTESTVTPIASIVPTATVTPAPSLNSTPSVTPVPTITGTQAPPVTPTSSPTPGSLQATPTPVIDGIYAVLVFGIVTLYLIAGYRKNRRR